MTDAKVRGTVDGALNLIEGWGLSARVLQRLGAFIVVWGIVETSLEGALWALRKEDVNESRPSTDKSTASDWFPEFQQRAKELDPRLTPISDLTVHAALQVMNYRHAIAHGWLVSDALAPTFHRNPSWHGELRKRPKGIARVTEEDLDLAIDAAWTLAVFIMMIRDACQDLARLDPLESMKPSLVRVICAGDTLDAQTQLMHREELDARALDRQS